MVQLTENYAPEQTEESQGFDPLPAGEYPAVATDSELKDTKAGDGKYLNVTFEVIEGSHKGRKVWARYNLVNPNKQAEQIGHQQLKQFATAAGKPNARDSEELHNVPLVLKVTVRDVYNDVKDVKPYRATAVSGGASGATAAGGDKPSWMQ